MKKYWFTKTDRATKASPFGRYKTILLKP